MYQYYMSDAESSIRNGGITTFCAQRVANKNSIKFHEIYVFCEFSTIDKQ